MTDDHQIRMPRMQKNLAAAKVALYGLLLFWIVFAGVKAVV